MNMLRELGESLAPPGIVANDPRPPADLRRRVLTTARDRRPRWTVRTRLAWQLGVVTAGVLALAVALAPNVYRTGSAPPHADRATVAVAVLRLAAQSSAALPAPARPDQYVFIESVRFVGVGVILGTKPRHKLDGPQRQYAWWPADGARDGYYKHLPPYSGLLTDRGRPKGAPPEKIPTEGPLGFLGGWPALPTDPDQMYAYLYRDDPEDIRRPEWTPDHRAWDRLVFGVISQTFANPAAQAAALQAAQRIGGVEVRKNVTDVAGRAGIAVGRTEGNMRYELVFDAKTYRYLGHNDVWTEDIPDMGIKAGDLAGGEAYLRTAFVDKIKQVP